MSAIQLINPLQEPGWDNRVMAHPQATPFHTTSWLRTLNEAYGYEPLAWVQPGSNPASLCVAMDIDTGLRGRRGVSLPFSDLCPPLLSQPEHWPELFEAMKQEARARKWKTLEIRGGITTEPSATFYRHTFDLSPGLEEIKKRIHHSTHRNIKKAERNELQASMEQGADALDAFCRLNERTRRKHGLPPQPRSFFDALYRNLLQDNLGEVALVRDQEGVLAAALFLRLGDKVFYKYGASDERKLSLRGNDWVMVHALEHYTQTGMRTLCLGRTDMGHEGLRRFKLGWGTDEQQIYYTRYDMKAQRFIPSAPPVDGIHNHLFRHMPLPVLRGIGNALYKHMA